MPARFSWVDQRALDRLQSVDNGHAYGLYLILLMLADRHGVSYYSDKSLSRRLRLDIMELRHVRRQLIDAGLLAYRSPFYQVKDLQESTAPPCAKTTQRPKIKGSSEDSSEPSSEDVHDIEEIRRQVRAFRESLQQQNSAASGT
jgi:hypothetical protein